MPVRPARRVPRLLVVLAAASIALTVPPAGAAGPRPDGHTQPLIDGCQRSNTMELTRTTPEWVYVNRPEVLQQLVAGDPMRGVRTITGRVVESRPAGEDLYITHDFHDMNVFVDPDPASEFVLAEGQALAEGELEASNIPMWAMPAPGDRVVMSGAWIWDCGHWGNSAADPTGVSQFLPYDPVETLQDLAAPGAIRGEETELHPFHELATTRLNAAGSLRGRRIETVLSQLDVWINGDGGPALAEAECALLGLTPGPLTSVVCAEVRDVGGDYTYVLPVGPKPARDSKLEVNPLIVHPETHAAVRNVPVTIVPDASKGVVRVSFTLPHSASAQPFGITVRAGWSGATRAVRHRVRIDAITIHGSLDGATEPNANPVSIPAEQTPAPGEWAMYAEVSGHWAQLPILEVRDGQTIPLGLTLDFWLPPGVTPTLFASGHECDEPIITCAEGYGREPGAPSTELGFNDRPGRIELMNAGVPLSRGTHLYGPTPNPAGAGNEDLSDAICGPKGCYQLRVTWTAA